MDGRERCRIGGNLRLSLNLSTMHEWGDDQENQASHRRA